MTWEVVVWLLVSLGGLAVLVAAVALIAAIVLAARLEQERCRQWRRCLQPPRPRLACRPDAALTRGLMKGSRVR